MKTDINDGIKQFCDRCPYNDKGNCRYGEEYVGTRHPRPCEEYVHQ